MIGGIVSFIVGCLILLYLKGTDEPDITITITSYREPEPPPIKREEEIIYKYREEKPSKEMPGESVDFEEIKD